MDPDTAYDELCSLLDREPMSAADLERALDLCEGLIGWVERGGFLPAAADEMGRLCFLRVWASTREWVAISLELVGA